MFRGGTLTLLRGKLFEGIGLTLLRAAPPSGATPAEPDVPIITDWSVADLVYVTGGRARITFASRPALNGGTAVEWQYRINAGAWVSTAVVNLGTYDITSGLTDGVSANIEVQYVNSVGGSGASDIKAVTTSTAAAVPTAPAIGDWSVADLVAVGGGQARLTFASLPALNGGTAVEWEYRINGGAWTGTGVSTTGTYDITSGLTDGVAANIELRFENSAGFSAASDTKSVTTSAASGSTGAALGLLLAITKAA